MGCYPVNIRINHPAAQAAIDARLAEIEAMSNATLGERVELEDARNGLLILVKKLALPVGTKGSYPLD
jgi:hypothetical protein